MAKIIDRIRQRFPDTTWTYNLTARWYDGGDGSHVCWVGSADDDDPPLARLCRYFNDDRIPEWL